MTISRTRARGTALVLALGLALLGTACKETTVARLLAEPNRWQNREVGLKGDVVDSVSFLGRGAYKLDDGTGTIWVVSTHGVPRRGARVGVRGTVKDVVDLGRIIQLPEQIGSGLVLTDAEHRAR
jgi:hypothetical protein